MSSSQLAQTSESMIPVHVQANFIPVRTGIRETEAVRVFVRFKDERVEEVISPDEFRILVAGIQHPLVILGVHVVCSPVATAQIREYLELVLSSYEGATHA